MNRNRFLILIVVFALGVFSGVLIGAANFQAQEAVKQTADSETIQTFSIMLDFGDGKIETFHDLVFKSGENLFAALEKITADKKIQFEFQDYKDLGKLVVKIGHKKNGEGDKYWQYWVNNKHAQIDAGQYILKAGDVVEWKFSGFKGE